MHASLVNIPTYFVWISALQGKSWPEIRERFKSGYKSAVLSAWGLWFPVQAITFGLVPPPLRILWVKSVSLLWNGILSFISNQK
mmetsp:Transcript_72791/g.129232  ORF Transcript_72791/g.129232 Transcript_72791/m.129232 type:complete len:84 (-) Transcript_72791:21-272(-)